MPKRRNKWNEFWFTVIFKNGERIRIAGTHHDHCEENGLLKIFNDNYYTAKEEERGDEDFGVAFWNFENIAGFLQGTAVIKRRKPKNGKG